MIVLAFLSPRLATTVSLAGLRFEHDAQLLRQLRSVDRQQLLDRRALRHAS